MFLTVVGGLTGSPLHDIDVLKSGFDFDDFSMVALGDPKATRAV